MSNLVAVSCGKVVSLWGPNGEYKGDFGRGLFGWCRGVCVNQEDRYVEAEHFAISKFPPKRQ